MANADRSQPGVRNEQPAQNDRPAPAHANERRAGHAEPITADSLLAQQFRVLANELIIYVHEQRSATQRLVALQTDIANYAAAGDSKKSLPAFLVTLLLRVIATATAIVFGAFAILSWKDAQTAMHQADTANILALAALCAPYTNQTTSPSADMEQLCAAFSSRAGPVLSQTVAALLPPPTSTAPSSPPVTGGAPTEKISTGLITGIVTLGISVVVVVLSVWSFAAARKRNKKTSMKLNNESRVGAFKEAHELGDVGDNHEGDEHEIGIVR